LKLTYPGAVPKNNLSTYQISFVSNPRPFPSETQSDPLFRMGRSGHQTEMAQSKLLTGRTISGQITAITSEPVLRQLGI
jgi:hypothetical protein